MTPFYIDAYKGSQQGTKQHTFSFQTKIVGGVNQLLLCKTLRTKS